MPSDNTHAFSLVELIVAIGITMGMAAIMITIVVNLLDTAQRASGSLVASNQAKVALDFIAQDLQSAVMKPDGNVWLAATIQPDQTLEDGDAGASMADWTGGTPKPGIGTPGDADSSLQLDPKNVDNVSTLHLEDYRFGQAGVWLRLFTTEPDTNTETNNFSTVRAVSYQIVRYMVTDEVGASRRYGLFRSWVRPFDSDAARAAKSVFGNDYNLFVSGSGPHYNNPDFAGNLDGDPDDELNNGEGDTGCIRRPTRALVVGNNVIDFGVRFWSRDPSGNLQLLFPATSGGLPSNDNRGFAAWSGPDGSQPVPSNPVTGSPTSEQMSYGFPDVADIFVRVLSDDGAKLLEVYELAPPDGISWWDVAIAHSQVFTRRVELRGKAL